MKLTDPFGKMGSKPPHKPHPEDKDDNPCVPRGINLCIMDDDFICWQCFKCTVEIYSELPGPMPTVSIMCVAEKCAEQGKALEKGSVDIEC